jgi:hypothetical protein
MKRLMMVCLAFVAFTGCEKNCHDVQVARNDRSEWYDDLRVNFGAWIPPPLLFT